MEYVIKWKWPIVLIWILTIGLLLVSMPNLGQLVRDKGQVSVPEGYSSKKADELLKELDNNKNSNNQMSVIVVFHEKNKLTNAQFNEVENEINHLDSKKNELGITKITSYLNNEEMKEQLISKDETTVLTLVTVDNKGRTKSEIRNDLNAELKNSKVHTYLTGSDLISEDFTETTQAGVHKTEGAAIAFIIIVLIIVFRSPISPIVSLLTVALAYLASLGAVTQLVEHFNFPYSNFTQIFLILVLFGIGTDYNILLFSRFREELIKQESVLSAITQTYRTAGKTVFYSGLTVFIGFSVLGLAQFQLFKSASAVGIGVGILLVALFTILPFFMALLGNKLFWPSKNATGHKENKLTAMITKFSIYRPILGLILTTIICVPELFFYHGQLSYNSLQEISQSYSSVNGINIVYDHFPQGQALPTNLVLKSDHPLDSDDSLAFIDAVSESLQSIKGVEKVYSATRPKGEKIPELYTDNQTSKVSDGVGRATDGVTKIKGGLLGAANKLNAVPTDNFNKVNQLISGTKEVKSGIDQTTKALTKISDGLVKGTAGTDKLNKGMTELNRNLSLLTQSTGALSSNVNKIQSGYNALYTQYQKIADSVNGLIGASQSMNAYIVNLGQSYSELEGDANYQALQQVSKKLNKQLQHLYEELTIVNEKFTSANQKLDQINSGIKQINIGQEKVLAGSVKLGESTKALEVALNKGTAGHEQVIQNMPKLSAGLSKINEGQIQLNAGLTKLKGNMGTLQKGLNDSVIGLGQVNTGFTSVKKYLEEVSNTSTAKTFFIPEDVLTGKDFQKSLDTFMSGNRKITKWTIVLSVDPYSNDAMNIVKEIDQKYQQVAKDYGYEHSSYGIGGISSQNNDLNTISTSDFTKTASIMLIGILIVLFVITRSFWMPLYIITSLVGAYFTALSMTENIFRNFTKYDDLTWTIPFFAFIMIVALGVDYSIFLMMRYREFHHLSPREAILEAMKQIGGVIISAVIILTGTFAAMYPSGVLTLTQLATTVIIALFLLAFILLPMFLPSLTSVTYRTNKFTE